jgi:hypothetical protein
MALTDAEKASYGEVVDAMLGGFSNATVGLVETRWRHTGERLVLLVVEAYDPEDPKRVAYDTVAIWVHRNQEMIDLIEDPRDSGFYNEEGELI